MASLPISGKMRYCNVSLFDFDFINNFNVHSRSYQNVFVILNYCNVSLFDFDFINNFNVHSRSYQNVFVILNEFMSAKMFSWLSS